MRLAKKAPLARQMPAAARSAALILVSAASAQISAVKTVIRIAMRDPNADSTLILPVSSARQSVGNFLLIAYPDAECPLSVCCSEFGFCGTTDRKYLIVLTCPEC